MSYKDSTESHLENNSSNIDEKIIPDIKLITYKDSLRPSYSTLLRLAKNTLYIVDPYIDIANIQKILGNINEDVVVNIYTSAKHNKLTSDYRDWLQKSNQKIEIKEFNNNSEYQFHDRFLILDLIYFFHLGSSLNSIFATPTPGSKFLPKVSLFLKIKDQQTINQLKEILESIF